MPRAPHLARTAAVTELLLFLGLVWWIAASGYPHSGQGRDLMGAGRWSALWFLAVAWCEGARAHVEWRDAGRATVWARRCAFAMLALTHALILALDGTAWPYRWQLVVLDVMCLGLVGFTWYHDLRLIRRGRDTRDLERQLLGLQAHAEGLIAVEEARSR